MKCETKYQSSRKRCVPKIPGHVLEKNTRNLYRFFFSLFQEKIRSHVRPHGRLYGRFCRTRGFCIQRYLSSLFPAVPTKTMVTRSPLVNCISTLACKGPVRVAVLTNFYDRFFFEVGQFILSKSFHLGRHFFSFAYSASLWRVQSWKRVFRKSTSLPETVSAWSA